MHSGLSRKTDTVHFGGASVPNATIGYATDLFDLDHGLMGVGYPALEGTTNKYPDIPLALYNANVTNTVAYSLWLNDQGEYQFLVSWRWVRITALT